MQLEPLPSEWRRLLERFRIRSQRYERPALTGGHLMRRKGQSLEFRDFGSYVPGDDIRHVDWRASARSSGDDLLVRRFMAEDQLTLVVSIDHRQTMHLPEALPKLQVAVWLAEALAHVASAQGDRVFLHSLFGGEVMPAGPGGFKGLKRFFGPVEDDAAPKLKGLMRCLPPTAIWLVISDLYFDMDAGSRRLAAQISASLAGYRWVICLDLDAWPHERALLGQGNRELEGPGLTVADPRYQITAEVVAGVEAEIQQHKAQFENLMRPGVDRICWRWPADQEPAPRFFRDQFFNDPVLRRLFMRAL